MDVDYSYMHMHIYKFCTNTVYKSTTTNTAMVLNYDGEVEVNLSVSSIRSTNRPGHHNYNK